MSIDDKLMQFSVVALNAAEQQKVLMLNQLDDKFKKICAVNELRFKENSQNVIKKEKLAAERERNKKIIDASIESRKSLIEHRLELVDKLFDRVSDKINDFVNNTDYEVWLVDTILRAKSLLSDDCILVYLCPHDQKLSAVISEKTGARVEISDVDFIGGCKVLSINGNRLIDNSIKSRFEKERHAFNKLKIKD